MQYGLAATVVGGLVVQLNDQVRVLNQLSKQSGVSVSEIQKLGKAFRETGLDSEKLLDINQDVLDHLGDAFRNGGGVGDDIKAMGLDVKDYTQYLNQADGGLKAVIDTYYRMKAAGNTIADQKQLLESLGSDASRLTGVLDKYKNTQEALNAIQRESVTITNETAAAFSTFDGNLNTVTTSLQTWLYSAITPTVEELNSLYALMNKDWSSTDFMQMLYRGADNFLLGGKGVIPDTLKKLMGKDSLDSAFISGSAENDFIKKSQAGWEANHSKFEKPKAKQLPPGWTDPNAAKNAADKAARDAAAAAKKAQAEAEKAAKERTQALEKWDKLLVDSIADGGKRQLDEIIRQGEAQAKAITESGTKLGKSKAEIQKLLDANSAATSKKTNDELMRQLGLSNPNQSLLDQINTIKNGGVTKDMANQLGNSLNNELHGEDTIETQKANMEARYSALSEVQQALYDKQLISWDEFQKRKLDIENSYTAESMDLQQKESLKTLDNYASTAGSLADIAAKAFGKQSGAAKAFVMAQAGFNIASATMSMYTAISKAMAEGITPADRAAAMASVAAQGATLIAGISSVAGQFHDGIDSVPQSMNNKSFLLAGGERVVNKTSNDKLTRFLDSQNSNSNGQGIGNTTINAPLVVNGSDTSDDKKFNEMLQKHKNNVMQAVNQSQQRNR